MPHCEARPSQHTRLPALYTGMPVHLHTHVPPAVRAACAPVSIHVPRTRQVRFDGAAGGLKGLRVLTLAHAFMGAFGRGLSFVVDVRQVRAWGQLRIQSIVDN